MKINFSNNIKNDNTKIFRKSKKKKKKKKMKKIGHHKENQISFNLK